MPILTDKSGNTYTTYSYAREDEFERKIVEMADMIFGQSTIYIAVKKQMKGNDIITIPDGYLIDMTEPSIPKLFVVENEIVSHDPFKHIGIQLLKFVTSFEGARTQVRNYLMDAIVKNPQHKKRLEKGCEDSSYRNIDNYLDAAVYSGFKGLVVIDEAKPELHNILEKINANISVLEFKTFEDDNGNQIHLYDTLYDEYDDTPIFNKEDKSSKNDNNEAKGKRRERRAQCDTVIVPAREDGFKEQFLANNQWFSIRIGAAMRDKIKYIAAYQVAPVSAITHVAEVKDIRPYKDSGKYLLEFTGPAKEIKPIKLKDGKNSPQGPVYVKHDDLMKVEFLEQAMEY